MPSFSVSLITQGRVLTVIYHQQTLPRQRWYYHITLAAISAGAKISVAGLELATFVTITVRALDREKDLLEKL